MSQAVITLGVELSPDVARVQGQVRGATRSAQAAINAEVRRGAAERKKIQAEEVSEGRRAFRSYLADRKRAESQVTADARAESARRRKVEAEEAAEARRQFRSYLADRKRAAAEITKAEREESQRREREAKASHAEMARDRVRVARQEARELAQIRRQETRELARTERQSFGLRVGSGGAGVRLPGGLRLGGGGGGGQAGFGGGLMGGMAVAAGAFALNQAEALAGDWSGRVRSARMARARPEEMLNSAIIQTGVQSTAEAAALRRQVYAFVNSDRGAGATTEDVAQALSSAQTRRAMLLAPNPEGRRQRMEDALDVVRFARVTYQDPAQALQMHGWLGQEGIHGEAAMGYMRQFTSIARLGAIDMGTMTQQNLRAITLRAETAAQQARRENPSASAEQISAARGSAAVEAMTELQVLAPRGYEGVNPGRRLAGLEVQLGTRQRQDLIRSHLLAAQQRGTPADRAAMVTLERDMFEDDPTEHGHRRLRDAFRRVDAFGQRLAEATHNDPSKMMDIMSGQPGNGTIAGARMQGMLLPDRALIAAMNNTDAEGMSGWQAAGAMARSGLSTDISEGLGASLRSEELQTAIVRADELRVERIIGGFQGEVHRQEREDMWSADHPVGDMLVQRLPFSNLIQRYGNLGENSGGAASPSAQTAQSLFGSGAAAGGGSVFRLPEDQVDRIARGRATVDPHDVVHAAAASAGGRPRHASR